eukprot:3116712-Rhodomonas_salina.1
MWGVASLSLNAASTTLVKKAVQRVLGLREPGEGAKEKGGVKGRGRGGGGGGNGGREVGASSLSGSEVGV